MGVQVVHRLDALKRLRARQEHRAAAEERLDVVAAVSAQRLPDARGDGGLAAHVGYGSRQRVTHGWPFRPSSSVASGGRVRVR